MTGKSIKPQMPMSEIYYLPPADKTNQEIQDSSEDTIF